MVVNKNIVRILAIIIFMLSLVACDQVGELSREVLGDGGGATAVAAALTPVPTQNSQPTPTLTQATATIVPTATDEPAVPVEPIVEPTATATTVPESKNLPVRFDGPVGEMALVAGGVFDMGAAAEQLLAECDDFRPGCQEAWFAASEPIHMVTLDPFYMDIFEVTNTDFATFLNTFGSQVPDCDGQFCLTEDDSQIERDANGRFDVAPEFADHPVAGVSWFGAEAFCTWRNVRLPSEAEWEMAAAWDASTETKLLYPWGDDFDGTAVNFCDANCEESQAFADIEDGYVTTAPVGSFENGRSPSGIKDMAGNVWEWVGDWYTNDYSQAEDTNPTGPEDGDARIVRGGSWFDTGNFSAAAVRFPAPPDETGDSIGFRCALDAQPDAIALASSSPGVTVIAELPATTEAEETETSEAEITETPEAEATEVSETEATATPEPTIEPTPIATVVAATATETPTGGDLATGSAGSAPISVNCEANPGVDLGSTYVVGACDWMSKVARKLGVTYNTLLAANPQVTDPNVIYAGQILTVPAREGAPAMGIAQPISPPQPGDSISP